MQVAFVLAQVLHPTLRPYWAQRLLHWSLCVADGMQLALTLLQQHCMAGYSGVDVVGLLCEAVGVASALLLQHPVHATATAGSARTRVHIDPNCVESVVCFKK